MVRQFLRIVIRGAVVLCAVNTYGMEVGVGLTGNKHHGVFLIDTELFSKSGMRVCKESNGVHGQEVRRDDEHHNAAMGNNGLNGICMKVPENKCVDGGAVDNDAQDYQAWFDAVDRNHLNIMKTFLMKGFDPDTQAVGRSAALQAAAQKGNEDMVELLIKYKAAVNRENCRGNSTPLIVAISQGHIDIVQLLIDSEADVNRKTSSMGNTALYAAVKAGHKEIVRMLLEAGASADTEQPHYGTVLAYAQRVYDCAVSAKEMSAYKSILSLLETRASTHAVLSDEE